MSFRDINNSTVKLEAAIPQKVVSKEHTPSLKLGTTVDGKSETKSPTGIAEARGSGVTDHSEAQNLIHN